MRERAGRSSRVARGLPAVAAAAAFCTAMSCLAEQSGDASLHAAVRSGDASMVQELLAGDIRVDALDADGRRAFDHAVLRGDGPLIALLLRAGADVDGPTQQRGSTALHVVAQRGSLAILRQLLEAGARVDAVNDDGATPLHFAVQYRHRTAVELLLDAGAPIDSATGAQHIAPLHLAAIMGNVELVTLLLDREADPAIENVDGVTPLRLAIQRGHYAVADLLQSRAKAAADRPAAH